MKQYRITKYDPALRRADGTYLREEEWTSFGDVGLRVSLEAYEQVEEAYLHVVAEALRGAGITSLVVRGIENSAGKQHAPREGQILEADDFRRVIRSVLREEYWCRLEAADGFVHVGYDFYLYVGMRENAADLPAIGASRGLFVEPWNSPYFSDE